jgi:uridine kinase
MKGFMMNNQNCLSDPKAFSEILFEQMKRINIGIETLALYEFRYGLDNLFPGEGGWASVELDAREDIEQRINLREFYISIQLRPRVGDKIVLDETIAGLTRMLFVGLVTGEYPQDWVNRHFYFDVRGFYFLPRTVYFTEEIRSHFGGEPYLTFDQKQRQFAPFQGIGYRSFQAANLEVDQAFLDCLMKIIAFKGTPILLTLAGPTAAGKTEVVERLSGAFRQAGMKISSIAMDDFLIDNDYREEQKIDAMGKEAFHFEIFMRSLKQLLQGQEITIPKYTSAVSSHDPQGNLKAGFNPQQIQPADIIFIEGNFPFQIEEVSSLIGLKIVYLTDDPIRLKRKWKRDIDYRKKYDPNYFRNRYFRTQFLRANDCYRAQMAVCDLLVDTTGAAIWATSGIREILENAEKSALILPEFE